MWILAPLVAEVGASPVAPTTTMWLGALVVPTSGPSPPLAKASDGMVAKTSAMAMCFNFKGLPSLGPTVVTTPEWLFQPLPPVFGNGSRSDDCHGLICERRP